MKLTLKIAAVILGLILLVPIALLTLIDPNMFAPIIKQQANKHGIALAMGDLDWELWPAFGVTAENIRIHPGTDSSQAIASLDTISFLIQVKPLLRREFIIDHISISEADVNLVVDQNGRGNWQDILDKTKDQSNTQTNDTQTNPSPEDSQTPSDIDLDINRLTLTDSKLSYSDQQTGQKFDIDGLNLKIFDANLSGKPMPLHFEATSTLANEQSTNTTFKVKSTLDQITTLSQDFENLSIKDGLLTLAVYDGNTDRHEDINLQYSIDLTNLSSTSNLKGKFAIEAFNAREVLAFLDIAFETSADYALTQVAMTGDITGDNSRIAINPIDIQIDKTNISGFANVTNFDSGKFQIDIKGDQIVIDDYLSPTSTEETPAEEENPTDTALPLETIRSISGLASLQFQKIVIKEIPIKDIAFSMSADKGLVKINKLSSTAFEGQLNANATLDARGDNAAMDFNTTMQKFSLGPFFKYLEVSDKVDFTGLVNLNANGTSKGVTVNQLTDNLILDAKVTGNDVKFYPLNLEEQFCKLVDLINNQDIAKQKTWQEYSEMQSLLASIHFENGTVNVGALNAGIFNLLLDSEGKLNLAQDQYKFNLPLKLQDTDATKAKSGTFQTSPNGCAIKSNYWISRGLTLLKCQGSLSGINPVKDCRPDAGELKQLVKDYAQYKIKEEHGEDIEKIEKKIDTKKEKLKDDVDSKLKEKIEEEKLEEKLKGLFGKPKK